MHAQNKIEPMIQPARSAFKARNKLLAMFLLLCILDVALVIIARESIEILASIK